MSTELSVYRRLPLILVYVSKVGCGACSLFQDSWKKISLAVNMRGIIFRKVMYSKEEGAFPEVLKPRCFAFPCLILMTYNEYNRLFSEEKVDPVEESEIEDTVCVLKQKNTAQKVNCVVFNTHIDSGIPLPPDDLVMPDPKNISQWIARVQGTEKLWNFEQDLQVVRIPTIDFNNLKVSQ